MFFFFISFTFIKLIVVYCCSSINILFYIFLICFKRHISVICRFFQNTKIYIICQLFIQFVLKKQSYKQHSWIIVWIPKCLWRHRSHLIEWPFWQHRTWNDNSWFKMRINIVYKKIISVIHILLKMFWILIYEAVVKCTGTVCVSIRRKNIFLMSRKNMFECICLTFSSSINSSYYMKILIC